MRVLSLLAKADVIHAFVTNTFGAPITLKQGVLLGNFEVLNVSSLESPLLPVAGVSAQSFNDDLSDVIAQLSTHVKGLDFPEGKSFL